MALRFRAVERSACRAIGSRAGMPRSRDDAIRTLEDGHAALAAAVRSLSDEQMTRRPALGGGDWSVADLLGHVASWELRALHVSDLWRLGEPVPSLAEQGGLDAVNARAVTEWRRRPLDRIRRDATDAHRGLIDLVAGLSDGEWGSLVPMTGGRRHRLSTMLGSATGGPAGPFAHIEAHLPDVRSYVDSIHAGSTGSGRVR